MQNHTSFLLPAPPPRWLGLWPFLVDSLSSVSWKHLKTEINADTSNLICNLYTESDIFVAQDVFVLVTFVGYIFRMYLLYLLVKFYCKSTLQTIDFG